MKKVGYVVIILISLYIINNLIRSIYNLWQKQDLLVAAKEELKSEQNQQEKLKDELARVKRLDFVEQEARNKLFMGRPGEQVVIVGGEVKNKEEVIQEEAKPNWRQWFDFFTSK